TPHRPLLDEANARIADLMADAEVAAGTQKSRDKARAWHTARLLQDESPSLPWTLVALVGLAAWIGCALGLLLRGVGDDDRLRSPGRSASPAASRSSSSDFHAHDWLPQPPSVARR